MSEILPGDEDRVFYKLSVPKKVTIHPNGQMIEELNSKAKSAQAFRDIALSMSRRKEIKVEKKSPLAPLAPILQRFNIKL